MIRDAKVKGGHINIFQTRQISIQARKSVRDWLETIHSGISNLFTDVVRKETNVRPNVKNAVLVTQFDSMPVVDVISKEFTR